MNRKNWLLGVIAIPGLLLLTVLSATPALADTVESPISTTANENLVSVSPDGKWVATTGLNSGDVFVYDVEAGTATSYSTESSSLGGTVFNSDGSQLYIADYAGDEIFVMSPSTGSFLGTWGPVDEPWLLALTPDNGKLMIEQYPGGMVQLGLSPLTGFGAPFAVADANVHQICMSADGSKIFVPDYAGNDINVVEVGTNNVTSVTNINLDGPISCALGSDGSLFIGNALSKDVLKFDAQGNYAASSGSLFSTGGPYGLGVVCGKLYAGNRTSQSIAVLDPLDLSAHQSPLTVLSDEWVTFSGAASPTTHTMWFGGYNYVAGLVSVASNGCDTPPEPLPDTGTPDVSLPVALGGGAALLAAGIAALIYTARRRSTI